MNKLIGKLFIVLAVLLLVTVKGEKGRPLPYQQDFNTQVGGPYESSNSTARYALTKAIVDNHSLFLDDRLARFAAPDIVSYGGHYFSIFTPGVSFLAVPLYFLGKLVGVPQLFSYLLGPLMGLLAFYLIAKISRRLGASELGSYAAGFIFLFGTDALAYSATMTQHLTSTVLLLLGLLLAIPRPTLKSDLLFGLIASLAVLVDIPNLLMFIPIGFYLLIRHFSFKTTGAEYRVKFKLIILAAIFGFIPFIVGLGLYNQALTGSYTKIAQNIGRSNNAITNFGAHLDAASSAYDPHLALYSRNLVNGLYILLFSNERGILFYEPVILLGVLGFVYAYRTSRDQADQAYIAMLISCVVVILLTYGMFSDPWGGWSFGPRYLIPAAAILSAAIGPLLVKIRRRLPLFGLLILLTLYSLYVNTLGAVTTTSIPPKQEAEALTVPIPYTYQYNRLFLTQSSSSLVYNLLLSPFLSPAVFYYFYFGFVSLFGLFLLVRNEV